MIVKPGDIVVGTNPSFKKAYKKECLVLDKSGYRNTSGWILVFDDHTGQFWLRDGTYRKVEILIPKPGDEIIVTDPSLTEIYGREYTVIDCKLFPSSGARRSESIWVIGTANGISDEKFWLLHGHYEVLEEVGVGVVVGDKVIITERGSDNHCKNFFVVAVRGQRIDVVRNKNHFTGFTLLPSMFKLLKRESKTPSSSSCPDCNGTGKIQLFTSTVKCHCKEIEI